MVRLFDSNQDCVKPTKAIFMKRRMYHGAKRNLLEILHLDLTEVGTQQCYTF